MQSIINFKQSWAINIGNNFHLWKNVHEIHEIVFVDSNLNLTIGVLAWSLASDLDIYIKYEKSDTQITLPNLIKEVLQYQICMSCHTV